MKTLITLCLLLCLSAPHVQAQLVTGADFSWLTEQEAEGITFSDNNGNSRDCVQLLKGNGINAARFRVWVNPADNWCNADDVTEKARRASREGMKIMIDFHYSDSWADPSKQFTPEAWTDYDIHELCTAVYNHTRDVLGQLKAEGITVDWVQVGNETRGGMLYPLGKIENGENFAWLVNSGHDAVKSVFSDAKVIVHVDNGWDAGLFDYVFDYLTEHQARYDLIGMSLYPVNTYDSQSADYFRTSQWKEKADLCKTFAAWLKNTERTPSSAKPACPMPTQPKRLPTVRHGNNDAATMLSTITLTCWQNSPSLLNARAFFIGNRNATATGRRTRWEHS